MVLVKCAFYEKLLFYATYKNFHSCERALCEGRLTPCRSWSLPLRPCERAYLVFRTRVHVKYLDEYKIARFLF